MAYQTGEHERKALILTSLDASTEIQRHIAMRVKHRRDHPAQELVRLFPTYDLNLRFLDKTHEDFHNVVIEILLTRQIDCHFVCNILLHLG